MPTSPLKSPLASTLASPLTVRLPAVLADYACGRTMVCCRAPLRADLLPDEDRRVAAELAIRAPHLAARWPGALVDRGELKLMRQPGGQCVLLDAPERACSLHRDAGLDAMPHACRNYPRLVAQTPAGLEAALQLSCPTAAGMVTAVPQPFAWVERDAGNWLYPPMFHVTDRVQASRAADMGFLDLLASLPGFTTDAARTRHWWARLTAPWPSEDLVPALDAMTATAVCLAGLDVQLAGVQGGTTVAAHLHGVAGRVLQVARLSAMLRERPATTEALALQDAVVAVAHLPAL